MTLLEFWEKSKEFSSHVTVQAKVEYNGNVTYSSWSTKQGKWCEDDSPEKVLLQLSGVSTRDMETDIVISEDPVIITKLPDPPKQPFEIQQEVFDQLNEYFPDTPIGEQMAGEGDDVEPF